MASKVMSGLPLTVWVSRADLLRVDRKAERLDMTRSAFVRQVLEAATSDDSSRASRPVEASES